MIGTPYFLAPEIIVNEHGYNERVDVWALGISLIQLAEMSPPHADQNPMRALLLITTSEPPKLQDESKWSKDMVEFVGLCLVSIPWFFRMIAVSNSCGRQKSRRLVRLPRR